MALHSELEIYRTCFDLLGEAVEIVRNMRRDIKKALGDRILDACIELDLFVRRANIAADKEPFLLNLLERLEVIELLSRLCRDRGWIPIGHYAKLTQRTQSIGRQCNAWRTHMKEQGSPQQRQLFDSQGSQNRA